MDNQINPCLKCLFTIFSIFFAIVGGAIIALTLTAQIITNTNGGGEVEGRTTFVLVVLYVIGSVAIVIAILGAYGAQNESKVALILFLVCMVIGSLLMLLFGVVFAVSLPQVDEDLKEMFHDRHTGKVSVQALNMAESLQAKLHCCGVFSYEDWNNEIPASCECNNLEQERNCMNVPYSQFGFLSKTKSVYAQPCFSIILHYSLLAFNIIMGIFFTLAALALLGMILSSIMIHQLRYLDRPPILLSMQAVFTPQPPKYQELYNLPQY